MTSHSLKHVCYSSLWAMEKKDSPHSSDVAWPGLDLIMAKPILFYFTSSSLTNYTHSDLPPLSAETVEVHIRSDRNGCNADSYARTPTPHTHTVGSHCSDFPWVRGTAGLSGWMAGGEERTASQPVRQPVPVRTDRAQRQSYTIVT